MAVISRYNARDCTITVDGVYITQLGEDMVSFSKDEAFFEPVVGAQGDVIRSEINNPIYTFELTIQSTSPQKELLLSKVGSNETFPVWCVNKAMGERFGGSQAAIMEMPEISRGATAEDMTFSFIVFDGILENA